MNNYDLPAPKGDKQYGIAAIVFMFLAATGGIIKILTGGK